MSLFWIVPKSNLTVCLIPLNQLGLIPCALVWFPDLLGTMAPKTDVFLCPGWASDLHPLQSPHRPKDSAGPLHHRHNKIQNQRENWLKVRGKEETRRETEDWEQNRYALHVYSSFVIQNEKGWIPKILGTNLWNSKVTLIWRFSFTKGLVSQDNSYIVNIPVPNREKKKMQTANRGKEKMQMARGSRVVVPRPRLLSPYPQGDRDQDHHLGRGQEGRSQSLRNHCHQGKLNANRSVA